MDPSETMPPIEGLLVSDFDGTMTRHDFYQLASELLLAPDMPDYWAEFRAGGLTRVRALQAIFASIRADEPTVRAVVDRMELEPGLLRALERLEAGGWEVVVASAGCDWYIRILLDEAGVQLPVWANPGRFEPGWGLLMNLPAEGPFFSPALGVDKAAVVRDGLSQGRPVAFAGDGFPDLEAALLVPAALRFARGALAETLNDRGLGCRRFDRWSEIAEILCAGPASPAMESEARA
jgi:2,3-diketo-5-methylthio-1-phosphopentane phosphatase